MEGKRSCYIVTRGGKTGGEIMPTDASGSGLPWVDAIARSFAPVSFVDFHRTSLPARIARHGHLVRDDLRGVPALAFRVDSDTAFTWIASEGGVRVVEGSADAAVLVELSEQTFSEYIHD